MGLFSFFSRKKKDPANQANQALESIPEKSWRHSLSSLTIVTHPLGETPGTILERAFLYSSLASIAQAISHLHKESENSTSLFLDSSHLIHAMAAAEEISLVHYEIVGLTLDPDLGYSARMSADGKKFTTLFGEPPSVARASTPFHREIAEAVSRSTTDVVDIGNVDIGNVDNNKVAMNERNFVLAIDGIAYAHVRLTSVFQ